MSLVTLFLGLLVPWLAGMSLLLALPAQRPLSERGELAWIAGTGYFVGAFLLTLWMRALSQDGHRLRRICDRRPVARGGCGRWVSRLAARGERVARSDSRRRARIALTARVERRRAMGMAGAPRMDRVAIPASGARGFVATAFPLECVEPVGDEGTRVVRARPYRSLRG
jgi:hypothetical protein